MFTDFDHIPKIEVIPGYTAQFIHGKTHTIARWTIKKGYRIPLHHHHHEQIVQAIEGEFELVVDGEPKICRAGDIAVIPSNVPHEGVSITDCVLIDTFCPVREDYLELSEKAKG